MSAVALGRPRDHRPLSFSAALIDVIADVLRRWRPSEQRFVPRGERAGVECTEEFTVPRDVWLAGEVREALCEDWGSIGRTSLHYALREMQRRRRIDVIVIAPGRLHGYRLRRR